MLDAIRKKTGTWVVRILALFLILSFAVWGVEDIFRGRAAEEVVATVGEIRVTSDELSTEFRTQVNRLGALLGGTADPQRAKELGILDRTLDSIIQGRLYGIEADSLGLMVGDADVRKNIVENRNFFNEAGVFDRARFEQGLRDIGHTEGTYVATLRDEIRRRQLLAAIAAGSTVPDVMASSLYHYRAEKRTASYVLVPSADQPAGAAPTEAEIAAFYDANKALITAPEYRAITAIHLDPRELAKEIKPSEEQLREEFDARVSSLSIPERRRLRQIFSPDEAVARKASEALGKGQDFTDTAVAIAGMSKEALDIGLVTKDDLTEPLAEIAFSLPEGKPSAPVQTPLGWHILLIDKIEPGQVPRFEDVREDLSSEVALSLAVDSLIGAANKLDDSLAAGTRMEDAAASLNLKAQPIAAIDAQGRGPDGKPIPGMPRDVAFAETAFATELGEQSLLRETTNGGFFVLRVDRVIPPAARPLAEVRAEVIDAIQRQRRDDAAKAKAEALLEQVKSGVDIANAARSMGLDAKTSEPFSRTSAGTDAAAIPGPLAGALFEVSSGEPALAPYNAGYALGVVTDIIAAEPGSGDDALARVRQQLRASLASDLIAQYTGALRARHPVMVDRDALDAIN